MSSLSSLLLGRLPTPVVRIDFRNLQSCCYSFYHSVLPLSTHKYGRPDTSGGVSPEAALVERYALRTAPPILALLERLIQAHTAPGARVLDPCCGSGTTAVAAHRLGRTFVGIDRGELAVETTLARLAAAGCVPRVQDVRSAREGQPAQGSESAEP